MVTRLSILETYTKSFGRKRKQNIFLQWILELGGKYDRRQWRKYFHRKNLAQKFHKNCMHNWKDHPKKKKEHKMSEEKKSCAANQPLTTRIGTQHWTVKEENKNPHTQSSFWVLTDIQERNRITLQQIRPWSFTIASKTLWSSKHG